MSERPPMTPDDALNRYWNDLVQPTGDREAGVAALDPATADTVRRLQTLGAAPSPASSRERVRRAVRADVESRIAAKALLVSQTTSLPLNNSVAGANGQIGAPRPTPPSRPDPVAGPRRGIAQFATAALLLLLFGLGSLAVARWSTETPRRDTIPAAVGDGVLLDAGLPADLFPHGDGRETGLVTATVPPGPPVAWAGAANDPGLRVDYVLAGTYVVWTEGPARLVRAGGTPQEVLAGSEVELGPGDAWIARTETAFTYTNSGSEPARLLVWILTERPVIAAPMPPGWDSPHDYPSHRVSPVGAPARLLLRRVDVAAGDAVPAPANGGVQIGDALPIDAAGPAVSALLATQSDGAIKNIGQEAVTLHVVSLEPDGFPDLSGEGQALGDEG